VSLLVAYQGPIAAQKTTPKVSLYQEIMADVPLGYWRNRSGQPHGGHVPDSSGNGLYLVVWQAVTDAPSLIASDPSDLAWHLDAGENFWSENRWPALDLTGDLSLSFWMRPTIFGDADRDVVRKGHQYGTYIATGTSRLTGLIASAAAGERATVNGPVMTPGGVYHVGFTYEVATGTIRLYLNGALATAEAVHPPGTAVQANNVVNFVCGAYSDVAHGFDGDLDEVAVYGHLLPPERIHAHYVAGSGPALTFGGEVMADNPVAYWPMTDLSDVAGARTLTAAVGGSVADAASLITHGLANGAKSFNGLQTAGFIRADDAGLSPSAGVSYEVWIRPASIYGNWFLVKGPIGLLMRTSGQVAWQIAMDAGTTWIDSTTVLSAGQTYHIVGTTQGGTHKIYVNGALEGTVAWGAMIVDNANPLGIGGDGVQTPFSGVIDEVVVYNYALSPARILAHYVAGTT
jgi:Concanavalin A-like lectin/glucanases superfamily